MTSKQWREWWDSLPEAERDMIDISFIADLAACEKDRDQLLKAEKEMWNHDYRTIQKERDEWKAIAATNLGLKLDEASAHTLTIMRAERAKASLARIRYLSRRVAINYSLILAQTMDINTCECSACTMVRELRDMTSPPSSTKE
jgi:hypothetical protein